MVLKVVSSLGGGGGGNGTVTLVDTGTGLTGGPISTTGTISLANTAVTAGSYGSNVNSVSVTVDAQGRITSISNVAIVSGGTGTVTNVATGTGLTGGPITTTGTISLANTAVTPGTYGNATQVGQVTVDAQGRITSASNVIIAISTANVSGLGTMATQNANSVAITGGTFANANLTSVAATFPNSYLTNSSATLGNATVTLGGTTSTVGNLTMNNVTINSGNAVLSNITGVGYIETVYTITDGAAFEINPYNGTIQIIVLGANRTPKGTNFIAGQSVTMMIDDGTAYTITWTDATFGTGGVKWVGNAAPTLATTGYTVVELWKVSTQVYGALVGAA